MDNGPLFNEEIEAGATFAREFDRYAPLKAAFWLRACDDEYRYLYLTSDRITVDTIGDAYTEVGRLVRLLKLHDLDMFRIKVVAGNDALSKAAAEQILKYPESTGKRFGSRSFGNLFVGDGYVYPQLLPVAP